MEEASERERKRLRECEAWKKLREMAARVPPDRYQPIASALKVPGGQVCLFAVVAQIGAAVQSRGTDFTVTLKVVDESRKFGISVTFFAEDTAQLPCVKSSGDVISLHNVRIKHHGEFFVKLDKRFSSFALFESKVSAECSPYQTSIKYHGSKYDKEHLTRMRTWLPNNPLGLKDLELQLRSLKSDSTFDLVCKVLHVRESSGKWIFYVWDGTDTPAAEFQAISDSEAVESPPLLQGPPLPREVLCTMPCVGTVLRIFSDRFVKEVEHMQNSVYWARFWNITCKLESGIWKGVLLESSGVRLLSHEDGSVVDRRNVEYGEAEAGYKTLMETLTHDKVTHKVKTLVRVVAASPCRASELPWLLTGNCGIRLTLEDPTARIYAYVYKDDVVKFFGGSLTAEVIIKKMNKLLGVPEPEDSEEVAPLTRNPPWIWCCLKSYYLDKNDLCGSRRYQIFATSIKD